ncbi:MAG TPA: hypothetical protein VD866_21340 [Urbifossiella sp.]|nr:hypothetical protein [Urbifossiella sp.]
MNEPCKSDSGPDTYLDRLVKYVPVEVLLAWVFVNAVIKDSSDVINKFEVEWYVFGAFAILTPVWIWVVTGKAPYPGRQLHMGIATISFVLWVAAVGGPFIYLKPSLPHYSLYAALALLVFSLAAPLLRPPELPWLEEAPSRRS